VAGALNPATRDALAERLRFYRDLGLTDFYRRPVDPALLAELSANPDQPGVPEQGQQPRESISPAVEPTHFSPEDSAIPPRKSIPSQPEIGTVVAPANRAAALAAIAEDLGECKRCPLHKGRHTIVFGQGDANARLLFVGEGPGADEDEQGLPFVGRAGQLLNNMISAMGLEREQTYICNVVKCRPPGNRTPEPEEANTCSPFLFRQIDVVRPQVIVALGATAATYLLGQRQPLAGLRGCVHAFRGSSLIVTYHPAYLLRDPRQKKEAWADLQIAMKELGLKAPPKKA
jgi:DNA polymerase